MQATRLQILSLCLSMVVACLSASVSSAQDSPVSISLSALGNSLIPTYGGDFRYTISVRNNTDDSVRVGLMVFLEPGEYDLLRRERIWIGPRAVFRDLDTLSVSGSRDPGEYLILGFVVDRGSIEPEVSNGDSGIFNHSTLRLVKQGEPASIRPTPAREPARRTEISGRPERPQVVGTPLSGQELLDRMNRIGSDRSVDLSADNFMLVGTVTPDEPYLNRDWELEGDVLDRIGINLLGLHINVSGSGFNSTLDDIKHSLDGPEHFATLSVSGTDTWAGTKYFVVAADFEMELAYDGDLITLATEQDPENLIGQVAYRSSRSSYRLISELIELERAPESDGSGWGRFRFAVRKDGNSLGIGPTILKTTAVHVYHVVY